MKLPSLSLPSKLVQVLVLPGFPAATHATRLQPLAENPSQAENMKSGREE